MDSTLTVAIAGLIATALSPIFGGAVQTHLQHRTEESARIRQAQQAVYADATMYVQYLEGPLRRTVHPYAPGQRMSRDAVPNCEVISAQMRLLAPRDVADAWDRVVTAEWSFLFDIEENHPDHDAEFSLPRDYETVTRLYEAVERFYQQARRHMGVER